MVRDVVSEAIIENQAPKTQTSRIFLSQPLHFKLEENKDVEK